MPYYRGYKRRRYNSYANRRAGGLYSVYRTPNKPVRYSGFFAGTRATYRRVRNIRRTSLGLIKRTYTIPELKFVDTGGFLTNVSDAGTILLMNGLFLGTGASNRVGQRIMIKSIFVKFYASGPAVAQAPTLPYVQLRAMIVWDAQPNGATFTVSDLLEQTSASLAVISPMRMANSNRFKIMWDQMYTLSTQQNATTIPFIACNDHTYQKVNLETHYADTNNGNVTDIRTGAIYLFFIAFTGGVSDNDIDIGYHTRLRFYDN